MGRNIGKEVLVEGRKHATLQIKGLVNDCSTNLGGLFKTRNFKNVKLQNCITHVKWIMARHVKIYAGIPPSSTKKLPKEWNWLLKLFYNIIDSKNETDIYINLEILRNSINRQSEKRIKRLVKAFKQLEKFRGKVKRLFFESPISSKDISWSSENKKPQFNFTEDEFKDRIEEATGMPVIDVWRGGRSIFLLEGVE